MNSHLRQEPSLVVRAPDTATLDAISVGFGSSRGGWKFKQGTSIDTVGDEPCSALIAREAQKSQRSKTHSLTCYIHGKTLNYGLL